MNGNFTFADHIKFKQIFAIFLSVRSPCSPARFLSPAYPAKWGRVCCDKPGANRPRCELSRGATARSAARFEVLPSRTLRATASARDAKPFPCAAWPGSSAARAVSSQPCSARDPTATARPSLRRPCSLAASVPASPCRAKPRRPAPASIFRPAASSSTREIPASACMSCSPASSRW